MKRDKELVEVYRDRGEAEAQIIRGLLESNDIPSILEFDAAYSASVLVVDAVARVKVMVRAEDAEQARLLLNSPGSPE